MTPALPTTVESTRTQPPATWTGLRDSITRTRHAADAFAQAHGSAASSDVAALCARTVEALGAARPTDGTATPIRGASHLGCRACGPAVAGDSGPDLVELVSNTLSLARAVLDNHDEPLNCAEVLAISRTVTALCTARATLAGVLR